MVQRYTEKARRAILFARYETSQFGSPCIESEHLLLGLLREDKPLANRVLRSTSMESLRGQIQARTPPHETVSAPIELPLSEECRRVLAYAAEEADRLSDKHIGTEHLLLGLLREEKCFAAQLLRDHGLQPSRLREELDRKPHEQPDARQPSASSLLSEFVGDVGHDAAEGKFDPLIGREEQLDRVVEILCQRSRNNPVLVGEAGVGKSALVEGLALRIEAGEVPERLEVKRILTFDLGSLVAVFSATRLSDERMRAAMQELERMEGAIVYIEGLFAGLTTPNLPRILKPPLDRAEIQCIAAALPAEWHRWAEREPWLKEHFYAVEIPAPGEADAIRILHTIKRRYEQFHGVVYSEEALENAVYHSQRFLPKGQLPDKAIDLMDEAGAAVAVRRGRLPEEMALAQKRIKLVVQSMEEGIARHEFEKARSYSVEEKKERERLQALAKKYNLTPFTPGTVGVEDIEEVLSRWTNVPIETIRKERHEA